MFILYYFLMMFMSLIMALGSLYAIIAKFEMNAFVFLLIDIAILAVQSANIYFLVKYIIKLIKREKFSKKEIVFFILAIIAFIITGLVSEWAIVTMVKNAAV